MKKIMLLITLLLVAALPASAAFSIVAFDPETGELGVAVASRYFAVGAVVPWAAADVGAIATQASVNVGYGPRALELLKEGLTAQQVMDRLFEEDTFRGKEGRQIAIVDSHGNVAVVTGPAASDWRGHIQGDTFSVQGNILAGEEVVQAMAQVFENTTGELAERLYAALSAGDRAGGDRRGRQSASMLVVKKEGGRNTNNDRYVFINVDDHEDPFGELRRLLDIQLGINHSSALNRSLAAGDFDAATLAARRLDRYRPGNLNAKMHLGFLSYLNGDLDSALEAFERARSLDANNFRTFWDRLIRNRAYEAIGADEEFVGRVLGGG